MVSVSRENEMPPVPKDAALAGAAAPNKAVAAAVAVKVDKNLVFIICSVGEVVCNNFIMRYFLGIVCTVCNFLQILYPAFTHPSQMLSLESACRTIAP